MTDTNMARDVSDWWRTSIIEMEPGRIKIRGRPIQDLIGNIGFAEMIWLTATGERLPPGKAALLESALVAAVDHGPQAPSIAAARMAATCGVGLNNAMATGLNMLGDVHGGAGEQAVELYCDIANRCGSGGAAEALADAVREALDDWRRVHGRFVPGFGHRFHKPVDPRSPRLLALVDAAAEAGEVSGEFARIGRAVETALAEERKKPVPMNIDGATAVIFAELGCPPGLARGLFCLSRSVGLMSHAYEQTLQGGRNKGPTPPAYRWTFEPDGGEKINENS